MASKYPDVGAYKASPDNRDIARRVQCDFVATGSGSFYSRSCGNLAAWRKVYNHEDGTVTRTNTLSCHRHRAIEERTADNRGYRRGVPHSLFPQYEAFDGMAEAKVLTRAAQERAEESRLAEISKGVTDAVAYIINHSELGEDVIDTLKTIALKASVGTLVVR